MTDEEVAAIRATWSRFRRVELYRGDPDGERTLTDELLNHIPALLNEVERLRGFVGWVAAEIPDWETSIAQRQRARELLKMTDDDD